MSDCVDKYAPQRVHLEKEEVHPINPVHNRITFAIRQLTKAPPHHSPFMDRKYSRPRNFQSISRLH